MIDSPELPILCPKCMYNVEILYHYLQIHALARNNTITSEDLYEIFKARINNLLPPPAVINQTVEEEKKTTEYSIDKVFARLIKKN